MGQTAKPLVAIAGRPNVGKSTLFNRLVGRRTAIVSEVPGTTRDRVTTETVWGDHPFILVDTGGLQLSPIGDPDLWEQVNRQINIAIDEADVIIMMVDAGVGVTGGDVEVAEALRVSGKPIVLAANKADNDRRESGAVEFYELGLGAPIPVSAYHNIGIDDLMAQVIEYCPAEHEDLTTDADLRLAIVGRSNVGKSMLLNAITEQERAIVSATPGTTRDSLDTLVRHRDRSVLLIDTAGIRRSGRIEQGIERYSVLRAIKAIDRADVAVLVIDAAEPATNQDTHVASYILDAHKGIVLAVNKWDLAPELGLGKAEATQEVNQRFKFASYAPLCFTSALRRTGIEDLLDTVFLVHEEWSKSLRYYDLRRTVMNAIAEHPPPSGGRRPLKIYGVAQDRAGPPSFTFYVNRSDMVHFSYQRYLESALRKAYGFKGSPLRMRFRGRGER